MKYIFFFILTTSLAGCFGKDPEKTGMEGKPLPGFTLLLSDSTTRLNTKNIPVGKPVVVFLFSPNCPYCRAQTKNIIENFDNLGDIRILMVTNYPFFKLKNYYNEFQLAKYPNITIGVDTARFFSDYFEVTGVPFTAVYGKDKKLKKAFMGKVYSKQIKAATEE